MNFYVKIENRVNKSWKKSVHKIAEGKGDIGEKKKRQNSPDINSTKNRHVAKADTTRESRYTMHEDSMRHLPQRSQNWASRPSRKIDQKF